MNCIKESGFNIISWYLRELIKDHQYGICNLFPEAKEAEVVGSGSSCLALDLGDETVLQLRSSYITPPKHPNVNQPLRTENIENLYLVQFPKLLCPLSEDDYYKFSRNLDKELYWYDCGRVNAGYCPTTREIKILDPESVYIA